ncbi:MAG: isocitrate/isopropylmalate family dehydrogenase [Acidimicrobiia bacterium]
MTHAARPAAPPLVRSTVPGWDDLAHAASPFTVGVLPGEGAGPEVVGAALTVLDAVAETFGLEFRLEVADDLGAPGPFGPVLQPPVAEFFEACLGTGAPVLCGAVGGRFVYDVRARFDLFCKFVPVRPRPELADASILRSERVHGVDVLVVRDNVGGIYQGAYGRRDGGRVAYQEAVYDVGGVDRLLEVAVRAASARDGRLAVVTKSGGIPEVSALWRERAAVVSADSGVAVEEVEVDNACYQLVADPARFDVVATPNLLGDVVADTAALVLGSRGLALSANFGAPGHAVYQTGHGAARDLAGRDCANPVAQIESAAMMLRESFDLVDAADVVEAAVTDVLAAGFRTPDIAGPGSTVVGTRALATLVAEAVPVAAQRADVGQVR